MLLLRDIGGAIFRTTDTETIVQLIKIKKKKFIDKLIDALFQIQGGYTSNDDNKKLVGVRDPYGIRPLWWEVKKFIYFCLETCALTLLERFCKRGRKWRNTYRK